MHRVGFGDCFLITFTYGEQLEDNRTERHVLIDFGSTSLPKGTKSLDPVAAAIHERTGGEIDAVVVTHRHRDHLSAFGAKEIVQVLEDRLPPKLVVRSWTEDPEADANFTGADGGPGADSLAFTKSLGDARGFADAMANQIATKGGASLQGDLHLMALTQLANSDAIDQLETWSANGRGEYLHYGMETKIQSLLPGVRVRVLGPPTIEQHAEVASERESDPAEFWMLYKQLVGSLPVDVLRAVADQGVPPGDADALANPQGSAPMGDLGPIRWLTGHLDRQQLGSFLRIVRIMDDSLNNTSVILLFEVDGAEGTQAKRMLFCGDAQIENWEYALKVSDVTMNADLLRQVDLYKVGHHGSRNATPRTLFNLWTETATRDRPMVAMMSTKSGVHGRHAETAVPRETLVTALTDRMKAGVFNTEELSGTWVEVSATPGSPDPFVETGRG